MMKDLGNAFEAGWKAYAECQQDRRAAGEAGLGYRLLSLVVGTYAVGYIAVYAIAFPHRRLDAWPEIVLATALVGVAFAAHWWRKQDKINRAAWAAFHEKWGQ
jgi:hypothetical protein